MKLPSKFPEKYTRCASFQISNRIKASCIFRPTLSFKFEKIIERINKFLKEKKSPGPGPKKVGPDDPYHPHPTLTLTDKAGSVVVMNSRATSRYQLDLLSSSPTKLK
jgi:hypothetical protein